MEIYSSQSDEQLLEGTVSFWDTKNGVVSLMTWLSSFLRKWRLGWVFKYLGRLHFWIILKFGYVIDIGQTNNFQDENVSFLAQKVGGLKLQTRRSNFLPTPTRRISCKNIIKATLMVTLARITVNDGTPLFCWSKFKKLLYICPSQL